MAEKPGPAPEWLPEPPSRSSPVGRWSRRTADLLITVDWAWGEDGSFVVSGQDLKTGGGDYEYTATIVVEALPALASALGVPVDQIADAWGARIDEIMSPGFVTWLRQYEIPYGFWTWHDFDWFGG